MLVAQRKSAGKKKKTIHSIMYKIVHAIAYAFSLLPFRVLYALSDCLYVVVYRIIGYRKKIVRRNLSTAFPEKSDEERRIIEKKFFHWLCDYFIESLKLLSITPEEFLQHMEFRGSEDVEKCFSEGQSCAAVLGHYCNWEWLSATGLSFKQYREEAVCGLIYHPLFSDIANQLFLDLRQHLGGTCVRKQEILRHLMRLKMEKRPSLFGYISDQAPKWENTHLWIPFLNHPETPVFTGMERIMRKMNNAVVYVDMQRPERGKYVCTFKIITRDPASLPEHDITLRFFSMLEESIRRQPEFYLWSHNRWKRTKEEFERRFEVVDGKVMKKDR